MSWPKKTAWSDGPTPPGSFSTVSPVEARCGSRMLSKSLAVPVP